ncbi:MAG: SAM-dependent methyltransferase [Desulfovibrionaceae bacterium]|nr:SAM-dependent methyltransferase [Desulfovibrionaceae bacterium]
MSEQKSVSETAEITALLRAAACFEMDDRIKGRDNLAKLFLSEERRGKLSSEGWRNALKERVEEKSKGLYEYVVARTAYFDELFADALKENTQIVLLGAGYDSRAYRFPAGGKIFEVDAPFTQERKMSILKTNGIDLARAEFVPVDFEKDDLFSRLAGSGYNFRQQTLFLWEGVILYLFPGTVDSTLRAIKQNSCGVLAFDYLNVAMEGRDNVALRDERVFFGMGKAEIRAYLHALGYRVLENLGPDEISARYLTCSNGTTFGALKRTMNFMKAAI